MIFLPSDFELLNNFCKSPRNLKNLIPTQNAGGTKQSDYFSIFVQEKVYKLN